MERTVYEAPVTERFSVELEGGFMAGSVEFKDEQTITNGQVEEHTVNEDFAPTFSDTNWD